jgi:hypothetical protein
MRAERGGQRGAAIEQFTAAVFVSPDAVNATQLKNPHCTGQDPGRVNAVPGDHGHHHVQLELAMIGSRKDRCVAANHLVADLVHHLGNGGIHFAGHNRRAWLHSRQRDFRESGPGTHAE